MVLSFSKRRSKECWNDFQISKGGIEKSSKAPKECSMQKVLKEGHILLSEG
jgi:hypothetical protein